MVKQRLVNGLFSHIKYSFMGHYPVLALGQIGDELGISVLERYRSGKDCDHEKYLCRREINKAIN